MNRAGTGRAGPATPVKVAYVLPGLERGGTEKHVLDLTARIDRRRFSPSVISVTEGGSLEKPFRELDVPVRILGFPGVRKDLRSVKPLVAACSFLLRFRDLLRSGGIRVVHSYLPLANILGTFAAALAGTPVRIVSKRGLGLYKEGHALFSLFEDAANRLADAVTVNSAAVGEAVRRQERFWGGKIRLVYNGVESRPGPVGRIDRLCPEVAEDGATVVTYVANLFAYKGHADLVEAARQVADAFPSVRFLLVGGDAGEEGNVRRRIEAMGLGRNVLLAGPRPDAAAIVAASAFLVHPSHQEGFSNAILEAMAAGKAVVATRVGGIPEAVEDGRTGLLVPPRDPAALAGAVLSLLRDPDGARAMGEAGRRRAEEEFSIGRMVGEIESLYVELLARKAPGALPACGTAREPR